MAQEIRDIATVKTVLDGTELMEGQEAAGGVGSTFQTTTQSLVNLINPYTYPFPQFTTATSTTAYTGTAAPAITAYATGQKFQVKVHATSTGLSTLALNGLVAKKVFTNPTTQATTGNLLINQIYIFAYDAAAGGFLIIGSGGGGNIYTEDGVLTGNRSVDAAAFNLNFISNTGSVNLAGTDGVNTTTQVSVIPDQVIISAVDASGGKSNESDITAEGGAISLNVNESVDGDYEHQIRLESDGIHFSTGAATATERLKIGIDGSWDLGSGADPGTAGQVIQSNGSATAPTWVTPLYSGNFSGAGTATTVFTVTIGATMANNTYEVGVTPTAALSAAFFYVTNKTTTTFDVTYLAGLTGTVTFDWILRP